MASRGVIGTAMARAGYTLLLWLIAPLVLLRWGWRGRREPLYRHALAERFGFRRGTTEPGRVWIHAVSLGETRAAAALIGALRTQQPGLRLLLTHGTATGREAGRALLRAGDAQAWLPYDTPGAVRRFLTHWRPSVGVLMETEVWPNLLRGARQAGVPMLLANARLSERSLAKGQRFAALLRPAMGALSAAFAQTEADAARLRLAGVTQVDVLGNLKFEIAPEPGLLARGAGWAQRSERPIVLAASTREGEEGALLAAWIAAGSQGSRSAQFHGARFAPTQPEHVQREPRLLLVPRHPQRFDEVARLVEARGLSLSRRSTWPEGRPDAAALACEVWLGDSLGEMPAYYAAARVALLGGSFAPLGGQNLIEAAACGCPVVMGPHTFNFADAAEKLLSAGAGHRVANVDEGLSWARGLVQDQRAWGAMRESGLAFAGAHRGAAGAMARAVLSCLR